MTVGEHEEQIKRQIEEVKVKLDSEWRALDDLFTKMKAKHEEINANKQRRDDLNQHVKDLIGEAQEKQKERDSLRESVKPKREMIKNLRFNIKEYAKQINELKDIRDGKHRKAKGSLVGLKDNIAASVTTLLTMDLSLKDEITLFDMIFASKDRYYAKVEADDVHNQIQQIYNALKESERQVQNNEAQIQKIYQESQALHDEGVKKFKEKDDVRNRSNEIHQHVMEGFKEIKSLKALVEEGKKNITVLKAELNELYKKLRSTDKKRREMAQKEKLEDAKKKLKGEKKMGLDELRLLIESGSLKK